MGEVKNIPKKSSQGLVPLSQYEAQKQINKLATDPKNILITRHAGERMLERDILYPDVLKILRDGIIRKKPEKRQEGSGKHWSYKVEYIEFFEEKDAACVVAIKGNQLILITVM